MATSTSLFDHPIVDRSSLPPKRVVLPLDYARSYAIIRDSGAYRTVFRTALSISGRSLIYEQWFELWLIFRRRHCRVLTLNEELKTSTYQLTNLDLQLPLFIPEFMASKVEPFFIQTLEAALNHGIAMIVITHETGVFTGVIDINDDRTAVIRTSDSPESLAHRGTCCFNEEKFGADSPYKSLIEQMKANGNSVVGVFEIAIPERSLLANCAKCEREWDSKAERSIASSEQCPTMVANFIHSSRCRLCDKLFCVECAGYYESDDITPYFCGCDQ